MFWFQVLKLQKRGGASVNFVEFLRNNSELFFEMKIKNF